MANSRSTPALRRAQHGHARHGVESAEYRSWHGARSRCLNPRTKDYPDYGGRGIQFDSRWNDFLAFLADMGPRPRGMTLERVDCNGPYSPENCRWASRKEQARNRRRSSQVKHLIPDGKHLADLALVAGLPFRTLYQRLRRGASLSEAMSKPLPAKKSLRVIEWQGKQMKLCDAANAAGLAPAVVQHRLSRGWSVERALTTPKQPWGVTRG